MNSRTDVLWHNKIEFSYCQQQPLLTTNSVLTKKATASTPVIQIFTLLNTLAMDNKDYSNLASKYTMIIDYSSALIFIRIIYFCQSSFIFFRYLLFSGFPFTCIDFVAIFVYDMVVILG